MQLISSIGPSERGSEGPWRFRFIIGRGLYWGCFTLTRITRADIIDAVKCAGVVGAGGAGFPTHLKLERSADIVLVNGAECEPLLRVDQLLAATYPDKVIAGLDAVMTATSAEKAVFGLKGKYKDARSSITECIRRQRLEDRIAVAVLPDVYPAGDEHVLVYELTGRVVPQGGIPLAVGVVVVNVETLLNIAGALEGKPVTHTWVTVGGVVRNPSTFRIPLGLPFSEAISAAGGPLLDDCAVIEGGPMMGRLAMSWSEPVTKLTKGLLLLPYDSTVVDEKRRSIGQTAMRTAMACDQCRNCTDLCPRYLLGHDLEPHTIIKGINNRIPIPDFFSQASLCSECGLCSHVACPAGLWPRRLNAELKVQFRAQSYPIRPAVKPIPAPRPERSGRMVPTRRLLMRLGLERWNLPAPISSFNAAATEVRISLRQHAGAAADAMVKPGDTVRAGQRIGAARDGVSANVHSSIDGAVVSVDTHITVRGIGS